MLFDRGSEGIVLVVKVDPHEAQENRLAGQDHLDGGHHLIRVGEIHTCHLVGEETIDIGGTDQDRGADRGRRYE
jgi:hypothetical protein